MNFPKVHLSRSSDRKMNKKNKTKKASGVEWSKLQREGGEGGGGRAKDFGCSVQDLSVLLKESEACVRQILFSLPLVMILDCFAKPST